MHNVNIKWGYIRFSGCLRFLEGCCFRTRPPTCRDNWVCRDSGKEDGSYYTLIGYVSGLGRNPKLFVISCFITALMLASDISCTEVKSNYWRPVLLPHHPQHPVLDPRPQKLNPNTSSRSNRKPIRTHNSRPVPTQSPKSARTPQPSGGSYSLSKA